MAVGGMATPEEPDETCGRPVVDAEAATAEDPWVPVPTPIIGSAVTVITCVGAVDMTKTVLVGLAELADVLLVAVMVDERKVENAVENVGVGVKKVKVGGVLRPLAVVVCRLAADVELAGDVEAKVVRVGVSRNLGVSRAMGVPGRCLST